MKIFSFNAKPVVRKSDNELISEYNQSGNLEFLGELYKNYMHLVYGVCLKYLKDRDESKDAVMQIFEKLIKEIPKQEIGNFRSWLHIVTRNHCLMLLRTKKSQEYQMLKWINDTQNFVENDDFMHPVDKEELEMENALKDCIEKLNDIQRECISLFYFNNLCYREIGQKTGLDEKKIKSHLQNGKRNLRICLENKDEKKG